MMEYLAKVIIIKLDIYYTLSYLILMTLTGLVIWRFNWKWGKKKNSKISDNTEGGPRSWVCAHKTLRLAPIDMGEKLSAHVSAESSSNISPNHSEVITEVSEP